MSSINNLTDIWSVYSKSLIKESTKTSSPKTRGSVKGMGMKPGKGAVRLDSDDADDIQNKETSDITKVDGYQEPIDPKMMNKKQKEDNLYEPDKFSSENFDEKTVKTYRTTINNNMKTFDRLFEDVMGDQDMEELDALGIDAEAENDDNGESDEITLTLDRETAQMLCDMITAQLDEGEDEGEDEDGDEFNAFDGEEAEEDDDEELEEATELKEVPSSAGHSLTSRKNTVGNVRASGGKAHGQVKTTVDGKGKPLADGKGKLTGKQNKVKGKAGSQGDLFA